MSTNHYLNGARNQRPDDRKLAELIIYVAQRSEGDEGFAATKLNKLLFLADINTYTRYGKSITGQEYQALAQGPCPRRLMPILDELQAEQALAVHQRQYHGLTQQKPLALRDPDLSLFTPQEIDMVNLVIHHHWDKSAREISAFSHNFAGWRLAEEGESIPYSVALIQRREPTQEEIAYGLELEASLPNSR